MNSDRIIAVSLATCLLVAGLAPLPASAQEQYDVAGDHVAIFNLAGEVQVSSTSGSDVVVTVERGGADAGELKVEVGEVGGRQALRVVYPTDRVHYAPAEWSGSTTLRVRSDGTWGGDHGVFSGSGNRVRISSRGSGLDAHADLRIGVPRGQRIDIYLAVGRVTAENVDGKLRLDTSSGDVMARSMAGSLVIDTGSGEVQVEGMAGDLSVDTGSGSVRVSGVTGDELLVDTGSGSVTASDVAARTVNLDTGSGGVTLLAATAADVRLDTGSGSVEAELAGDVDRLVVDTGSGSVVLRLAEKLGAQLHVETGSGAISTDFPLMVTHRSRDELDGTIGDGHGTIEVDTGSGSVRIRKL